MRKCIRLLIVVTVAMLCINAAAEEASSVMSSGIYRTEWEWKPGGSAYFEGNMICENVSEENPLIMRLSVDTLPGGTETVKSPVFTAINGEKRTVRKQKDEETITSSDQAVRFTGRWELPGDVRIEEATIRLGIYNRNGELLAESDLKMRNEQITSGSSGFHFPELGRIIRIIAGAAAVVWLLALIRMIRNRQRR